MDFNNKEFKLFTEEMKKAVAGVEKKFDVEIKFGSITYRENDFKIKTEVFNGSIKEADEVNFSNVCHRYDLEKNDFGKIITHKNKDYKISGIDTKRTKYSIKATGEDGEIVFFTKNSIKRLLGRN